MQDRRCRADLKGTAKMGWGFALEVALLCTGLHWPRKPTAAALYRDKDSVATYVVAPSLDFYGSASLRDNNVTDYNTCQSPCLGNLPPYDKGVEKEKVVRGKQKVVLLLS